MSDWLMVAVRTLLAIVVLFVMTKILGKRQISQLSFFEYITGITIGSLAAYISLDLESHWLLGIISLAVWVAVSTGIEFLQIKSKIMRNFIDGKPTVLIKDGKVMDKNLKKERLTNEELLEELRKKQAFNLADVEFAIMEPNGEINVLIKSEQLPITPKQLGIRVAPEKETQAVILDGKAVEHPLASIGLDLAWLDTELEKLGLLVEDVFIGQVDSYGQLTVDLYNDSLNVPAPQEQASVYAILKKCEADLELFSLTTRNKSAKKMYQLSAQRLQNVIQQIKPLLRR